MWVMYDIPDDSVAHVDEQMVRSVRDAIAMAQKGQYSCSMISVARIIEEVPQTINGVTDRDLIIETLTRYAEALDFTEKHLQSGYGLTRAVRTLVARAYIARPSERERLEEWCKIMGTGMPVSPAPMHDEGAITYRNFLMKNVAHVSVMQELFKYHKGQTALAHFFKRNPMDKVYGTGQDLFPLSKLE